MKSETKLLGLILHCLLLRVTRAVLLLVAVVLWTATALAQESKMPVSTEEIVKKLEVQSKLSEGQLNKVLAETDTSETASMDVILSRSATVPRSRSRGAAALGASAVPMVDIELQSDATLRIIDRNEMTGLILTGKWISDYARMIKLVPEYENTLATYKSQTEIQKQLVTELEGVIGVKDKKNEILAELAESQKKRGDLYKTMFEINSVPWYEKVFRKLAFPLGLTLGAYLGVKIAENN